MKVFSGIAVAAVVAGSIVACSGGSSVGEFGGCSELAPADGITGITSVEAGVLREVRFGVQADGSGGEVFLDFRAAAADAPIGLSDLALRVNYEVGTEAGKDSTGDSDGLSPVARTTCISPSRQVRAALADVAVSPLPNDFTPVFFEQAFIPGSGEYLVIVPDSGVDAEGYIQFAEARPVETQLVIDLRDAPLPLDTAEVFVSLTTISGGVLMASASVLLIE